MSNIFFYWDIKPGRDREYFDFIMNDYLPSMARAGIDMTDGWLKMVGDGPQVMALGESDNYATAVRVLESAEFRVIERRLLEYVENYSKHIAKRSNIPSEGR